MLRVRSIGTRFAILSLVSVLITTAGLLAILLTQASSLRREMSGVVRSQAQTETARVTRDIYLMLESANDALRTQVNANLNVARDALRLAGGFSLAKEEMDWSAVNQFTKELQVVRLPKVRVGSATLERNTDSKVASPVVDRVQTLVGGTATIFQRMNERGDMLRVATNVLNDTGRRAVGTYIPAVGADGQPNPVVAAVLSGKRYVGRAFVVNSWVTTAYEPIHDDAERVAGMLYVGLRHDHLPLLFKEIQSIVVGKTGYAEIIGGSGEHRGKYVVSQGGERNGEDIWETKGEDGRLVTQEIVRSALKTEGGEVDYVAYEWRNKGEPKARLKVSAVTYFAPWDWVIGTGAYEDDFDRILGPVNGSINRIVQWSSFGAAGLILLLFVISFFYAQKMIRPLRRLVTVAEAVSAGDLTQKIESAGDDEIGQLARAFAAMTARMREVAEGLHRSVGDLNEVVQALTSSAAEQNQAITRQAAALHESQVTAQEIKQTSEMAAQKAEAVMQVAGRADEVTRSGATAVERSVAGLMEIRSQAETIAESIRELGGRTREVGEITETVRDLADQSNILALNASIEAVRSGEQGKSFSIVAHEMRNLADQSIQSTGRVGQILTAITASIDVAVSASEKGLQRMAGGLDQVKASGENLQQLSGIVQENAAAARQIAAAISQQNAGVSHIFTAVTDLSTMMDDTVKRLEATNTIVATLKDVSQSVSQVAGAYRVS